MKRLYILMLIFVLMAATALGQVGINTDNSAPDNSAMLDVKSPVKGFLPPRVALTAINSATPLVLPATGLFVYNTASAGTAPNNVAPGYYCWNGARWVAVIAPLGISPGDMLYWNGTQYVGVPAGLPGQFLQMSSMYVPTWAGTVFATMITYDATNITASSAVSGGNITADGGSPITARGICFNTSPNPTIANYKNTEGSGTGSFTSSLIGLTAGTTYYLRAFAINGSGASYGNEISFTTLSNATLPTVYTNTITEIMASTATGGGTVNTTGGATVTARGICWSTLQNPTILDSHTLNGSGTGGYWSYLTGLTPNTSYYVRAYATNIAGTGYGNQVTFTTNCASYLAVSVSISASANPVCVGTSVTYTATPTNGGSTPTYQWKVNGTNVNGATNVTYTNIPANGDAVTCLLTSNASCITGSPALSNTLAMTVTSLLPVSVSIAASANPVSSGTIVTFTDTPVNGGGSPGYQWVVNGVNVGTNSPTYSYVPVNNDSVKCVLTSNQACTSGSPATSNMIVMVVTGGTGLPCPGISSVTYGGKTYNTVQIGNQCWFRENLNIGTKIDGVQEQTNNGAVEKYCYNGLESNCDMYGGLYQWNEMMNYLPSSSSNPSNLQGICPTGWHLPSDSEWCQMETFLDATLDCSGLQWRGNDAGGKMKEAGNSHWTNPNFATNISGFTALPGGKRSNEALFQVLTSNAYFWSATENSAEDAWPRNLASAIAQVYRSWHTKTYGFSVRCVKDTCSTYSTTGVSITPSANPDCSGTSVTFTATPTNGGTTPFFQWKVNGTPVGTNSPTYIYVPAYNDAVTCVMTSGTPCAANPATSNVVHMIVNTLPAVPIAGTQIASANQIQWNWDAVYWANGYKWNTENNYTTASEMGQSTTTTETGLTCNTSYTRYAWAYNVCGNSAPVTLTQSTPACLPGCGTITVSHTAGAVAPVSKTATYGTVTNITGETSKCWITSNLGADHQATAVDDATEASAGWYWQFNLKQGYKHDGTIRTPNTIWISSINENSDWLTTNDPCSIELGSGWRVPTITEWTNVDASGNWTDWNGPWNSGLKLNVAGYLSMNNGSISTRGGTGNYWSNVQNNATTGWYLTFYSASSFVMNNYKTVGNSVRCIKDCATAPSSPSSGTNIPTQTQIIWNWNAVSGATGYRWNFTNDYATSYDRGSSTTMTGQGYAPNTSYTTYVWAYNSCGASPVTILTSQTLAFTVGQNYGGGIIFYIYQPGDIGYVAGETHGLISATSDQASFNQWGCYGLLIGGTSNNLGTGQSNTTNIVNGCITPDIAARICDNLVWGGYDDWFLPSLNELAQMYIQRNVIGGFPTTTYYSSTESSEFQALKYDFTPDGSVVSGVKNSGASVRAIRAF